MANWCTNWVNFSGEKTQIEKVNAMFKAMQKKRKRNKFRASPSIYRKPKGGVFL
jgi:hypothetical protein